MAVVVCNPELWINYSPLAFLEFFIFISEIIVWSDIMFLRELLALSGSDVVFIVIVVTFFSKLILLVSLLPGQMGVVSGSTSSGS